MNCKNCGGVIRLKDNIFICENCETKYELNLFFENNEVCILNVNTDLRGVKTKDYHIAKELYLKLESAKISVFNEAFSLEHLAGDELEKVRTVAIANSSVVIIVGSSASNFTTILEKYHNLIKDKKIIPVFCDIKAEEIPAEINHLQAINYDSIGSDKNLIRGILHLLNRENEVDFSQIQSTTNKKRAVVFGVIIAVAIIIIGIVGFIVYDHFEQKHIIENAEKTAQEKYVEAQLLVDEGKYSDAANLLLEIIDYKESKSILKKIYDNYDGYYATDDKNIIFYINIQGTEVSTISLTNYVSDDNTITFNETVIFDKTIIDFDFKDTSLSIGKGHIELKNDGLILKTEMANNENSNIEYYFKFTQKSTTPIEKEKKVDKAFISKLLSKNYTLSEIERMGYVLEFDKVLEDGGGWNENIKYYKVKDSDVILVFNGLSIETPLDFTSSIEYQVEDPYLYTIIAPVEFVCPEKAGEIFNKIIFQNDLIIGSSELLPLDLAEYPSDVAHSIWNFPILTRFYGEKYKSSDHVAVVSKSFFSEERYNCYLNFYKERNAGKYENF